MRKCWLKANMDGTLRWHLVSETKDGQVLFVDLGFTENCTLDEFIRFHPEASPVGVPEPELVEAWRKIIDPRTGRISVAFMEFALSKGVEGSLQEIATSVYNDLPDKENAVAMRNAVALSAFISGMETMYHIVNRDLFTLRDEQSADQDHT